MIAIAPTVGDRHTTFTLTSSGSAANAQLTGPTAPQRAARTCSRRRRSRLHPGQAAV